MFELTVSDLYLEKKVNYKMITDSRFIARIPMKLHSFVPLEIYAKL